MRDSSVVNDEAEATRGQRKATNIIHSKFVSESKRERSKAVCVLTVFVQKNAYFIYVSAVVGMDPPSER